MHITGDISVGNILTLILATVSMVFVAGQLRQLLRNLVDDVQQLKEDHKELVTSFQTHEEKDMESFAALRESLVEVLLQARLRGHRAPAAERPGGPGS